MAASSSSVDRTFIRSRPISGASSSTADDIRSPEYCSSASNPRRTGRSTSDTKGEEKDDRLSKALNAINANYRRGTIFHLSDIRIGEEGPPLGGKA